MKLLSLVTLTASAQYGDTTGSDLTDAIFKSLMFCHEWINSVSQILYLKYRSRQFRFFWLCNRSAVVLMNTFRR